MDEVKEKREQITVLFAGDSGDGMQLTGNQFTSTHALFGNDISTFPNFPAEIRAPQGTVNGVSGFQVKFGSSRIFTPGDAADVLVAMNAAALKANMHKLKKGGILVANTAGFDSKNLKLANCEDENPLESEKLEDVQVYDVDITELTMAALEESPLTKKEKLRTKNMFVLGFLFWMFNRSLESTENYIKEKFSKLPDVIDANISVLKAGYNFGETSEAFTSRYHVEPASLEPGTYRSIMGNQGVAIGLIAAAKKAGLEMFYGSYPITPASDILHELAKHKNFSVKTFQAEDEIAAVTSAIGASFGGALGVTASSGPGIALKTEAIGLAIMLELPLVVVNVQRGGPSTGLPTKTEQADLLQAVYGRNGEAPIPVVAARSPEEAFEATYEAVRISVEHMTPVMLLSDGYIANGASPWKFPEASSLKPIKPLYAEKTEEEYMPYARDEKLVRKWAIPGTEGLEHRIGGLEKEELTGNVSYDPENHEKMVRLRAKKIDKIADYIPKQEIDNGSDSGKVLILSWGSTYGAVKTAIEDLLKDNYDVGHTHLRYLNPMPRNLGEVLTKFDKVLVPEMNDGQLIHIIQSKYNRRCIPLNKIQGIPFTSAEIVESVKENYA
jgi:2-oxoglutarate ferredoxin oxidoreductase subunit alpha